MTTGRSAGSGRLVDVKPQLSYKLVTTLSSLSVKTRTIARAQYHRCMDDDGTMRSSCFILGARHDNTNRIMTTKQFKAILDTFDIAQIKVTVLVVVPIPKMLHAVISRYVEDDNLVHVLLKSDESMSPDDLLGHRTIITADLVDGRVIADVFADVREVTNDGLTWELPPCYPDDFFEDAMEARYRGRDRPDDIHLPDLEVSKIDHEGVYFDLVVIKDGISWPIFWNEE